MNNLSGFVEKSPLHGTAMINNNANSNSSESKSGVTHGQAFCSEGVQKQVSVEEVMCALAQHLMNTLCNFKDRDSEDTTGSLVTVPRWVSAFQTKTGTEFWIVTENDHTITTVLLPREFQN